MLFSSCSALTNYITILCNNYNILPVPLSNIIFKFVFFICIIIYVLAISIKLLVFKYYYLILSGINALCLTRYYLPSCGLMTQVSALKSHLPIIKFVTRGPNRSRQAPSNPPTTIVNQIVYRSLYFYNPATPVAARLCEVGTVKWRYR
jgi:hypothetical protein